ncbi:phosphoenolpyruvate--protein phosphotransferase [bacterium AH-315-J19]|nr:phosphoenolpyruvate--protein phosphotransferase [Robiginitomaculum sp.]MBN4058560.1 phosphoenolpyruvate--protein phosphotransferase [bacterium AH-315-J19]
MKIPPIGIKPDPGANLLKRIRGLMASEEGVQARLDKFVKIISSSMKANVASIYLRAGDDLELCATKGLKQTAVHATRLSINEGLVGNVARRARVLNIAEAVDHPDFVFKEETGEQRFHSFLGVPLLRGGRNLGVLVVQGKRARVYSETEVENLLTAATLLAEIAVADERAGGNKARLKGIRLTPTGAETITGKAFADGLVQGRAVLHLPPVASGAMIAAKPAEEQIRLEKAIRQMRRSVDAMVDGVNGDAANTGVAMGAASKEIFESYRLFAYDRKWLASLREAVNAGLTAEAAVERVRNEHRARMQKARDPYLRARLHDLEDLANRMLRTLGGENVAPGQRQLPDNAVVFARNLGPAEVLDYDRDKLRGIVLEEGAATAHATIICRTLGIPLVGLAERVLDRVEADDQVLVDGEMGEVRIRPTPNDIDDFLVRVGIKAELSTAFKQQRNLKAVTKDGQKISLLLNAGLLVDLPGLDSMGADGIGLFRTEFQFMVSERMPRLGEQVELYKRALAASGDRPVTFRTLDLGGDKILPYADPQPEENPAIGWRAIRIGLDRPAMLRYQLRALLLAGAGQHLRIMFPMVATTSEFQAARGLLDKEIARTKKMGGVAPKKLEVGVMLETPALAWQIDAICQHADFVSVGANDLMQFFFAADRDNPRVAGLYDGLHPAALSLLAHIADRCKAANTQLTVCGEMAGKPLEAICLTALGYRNLSMPVTGIGPVKSAILALDAGKLSALIKPKITSGTAADSLREDIIKFCEQERIPV